MFYLNEDVENLERIFDQNERKGYLRVDLNENPGGLPDDFIKKVLGKVNQELISEYPETKEFQETLAGFLGVDANQICLTNGSAEAIRHTMEAYTRPGGKVVSVTPSYAMYEVYCNMYGRKHVSVPYQDDGFTVKVDDIISCIDDDTDMVIVLNPNNPVGDVYTYDEAERIIKAAQEHEAFVLIDEAYFYFYPNSFIGFIKKYDHIILTRTFSKLFSLAGCRLGYAVGRPEEIKMVQKLCTPHNVNAFGITFAQSIIQTDGMVDQLVKEQLEGKKYLVDILKSKSYFVNALEGNFVFIETKKDASMVTQRLKAEKKVLVKHYTADHYKNYIRVSTGTKDLIQKFVDAFLDIDK